MYAGSVSNVPAFFAMHDYPMPPNYNPADWIMVRTICRAFITESLGLESLLKAMD